MEIKNKIEGNSVENFDKSSHRKETAESGADKMFTKRLKEGWKTLIDTSCSANEDIRRGKV